MDSGIVKETEYGVNKDTDGDKLLATVELSDSSDTQEIEIINQAGIKTRPQIGHRSIIVRVGGGYKVSIGVDDNIDEEIEEGEVLIYSNSGGAIGSKIKLLTDGTIEVGEGGNFVAMSDLVDNLWATLYQVFVVDWIPSEQDGGAALKTAFIAAFPSPGPVSVASTNLKADD